MILLSEASEMLGKAEVSFAIARTQNTLLSHYQHRLRDGWYFDIDAFYEDVKRTSHYVAYAQNMYYFMQGIYGEDFKILKAIGATGSLKSVFTRHQLFAYRENKAHVTNAEREMMLKATAHASHLIKMKKINYRLNSYVKNIRAKCDINDRVDDMIEIIRNNFPSLHEQADAIVCDFIKLKREVKR